MEKTRVAVVGCGGRSWVHISRLMEFPDVQLVGFMDKITDRAQEKCEKAGQGKVYADYVQMLEEAKPDVLYVCVPPAEHGSIEREAIARGIHMMIEKPIALDMAMGEELCALARQKGVGIAVGFQDRYLDLMDHCRQWMQGRKVGLVDAAWVGGIPGVPWWPLYATSGGQVVEQNIHLYDMLRYLFGEADTVYCVGGKGLVDRKGYDLHDYSTAVITMKSGIIATLFTGCYRDPGATGFPNGMNIHLNDGDIRYRLRNHIMLETGEQTITIPWKEDWQTKMNRTFIDAVRSGDFSQVRSPYEDALKTLKLTLACNESMTTGLPVKL